MDQFGRQYFLQTRREIDTEKRERDRLLHFAVVVMGALGFAAVQSAEARKLVLDAYALGFEVATLVILTALFWVRRKKLQQIADRWRVLRRQLLVEWGEVRAEFSIESIAVDGLNGTRYSRKDAVLNLALSLPIYALIAATAASLPIMIAARAGVAASLIVVHLGISFFLLGRPIPPPAEEAITSGAECPDATRARAGVSSSSAPKKAIADATRETKRNALGRLRERTKSGSPDFYLALVGMIASLALGYLLACIAPNRLFGSHAEAVYWLQVVVVLQAIVLTWHEYAVGTVCFVWPVDILDSAIPFLFGLSLFACITLMSVGGLSGWFFSMAAFAVVTGLAYANQYFKAKPEKENGDTLRKLRGFYLAASVSVPVGVLFCVAAGLVLRRESVPGPVGVGLVATLSALFSLHAAVAHVTRAEVLGLCRRYRGAGKHDN